MVPKDLTKVSVTGPACTTDIAAVTAEFFLSLTLECDWARTRHVSNG